MENINKISETQLQPVSHPLGRHSIKDAMTHLGIKSKNSVNDYKKMVKVAFKLDLPRVLNEDKTLTDEGLQQIKFAKKFAGKKDKAGYTQAVWQANPALSYELPFPVNTPPSAQSEPAGAQVGQPSYSTNFDPFAGLTANVAIVKREISAVSLSEQSQAKSLNTEKAIANGQHYLKTSVAQLLEQSGQTGDYLGDLLADQLIGRAEARKQERLDNYLASQGVQVSPNEQPATA